MSFDSSHASEDSRSAARRPYERVTDAPHDRSLHRQRVLPDEVEPFFFIGPWHTGHKGAFMSLRQPHSNTPHAYGRNMPHHHSDTQPGRP